MGREYWVFKAKIAEKAERYSDMIDAMNTVVKTEKEISPEERNLFSVAYKNSLAAKRLAWRTISMVEQAEDVDRRERIDLVRRYRQEVEKEIENLCFDVLDLLEKYLIAKATKNDAKVYFLKMKGDYNRYLSEILIGDRRKSAAEAAAVAYKDASDLAVSELAPTDPIRLGLALNFAVFFYEILNSTDRACRLARAAFDDAVAELDTLSEDTYKDATLIMQLLRDNLTIWGEESLALHHKEDGDI